MHRTRLIRHLSSGGSRWSDNVGMADDPSKRGPRDRSRINMHEPYELRYWAEEHFRVTQRDIIDAVTAVGPMVNDVEQELRRKGKIR